MNFTGDLCTICNTHEMISVLITNSAGVTSTHTFAVGEGMQFRVGRDECCEVSLPQETFLSRVHCVIGYSNGQLTILDNQSSNGVFLNGQRIVSDFLVMNQPYRLGDCTMTVCEVEEETETAGAETQAYAQQPATYPGDQQQPAAYPQSAYANSSTDYSQPLPATQSYPMPPEYQPTPPTQSYPMPPEYQQPSPTQPYPVQPGYPQQPYGTPQGYPSQQAPYPYPPAPYQQAYQQPSPTQGYSMPQEYQQPSPTQGYSVPQEYQQPSPTQGYPAPQEYQQPSPTQGYPNPQGYAQQPYGTPQGYPPQQAPYPYPPAPYQQAYQQPSPTQGYPAPQEYQQPSPTQGYPDPQQTPVPQYDYQQQPVAQPYGQQPPQQEYQQQEAYAPNAATYGDGAAALPAQETYAAAPEQQGEYYQGGGQPDAGGETLEEMMARELEESSDKKWNWGKMKASLAAGTDKIRRWANGVTKKHKHPGEEGEDVADAAMVEDSQGEYPDETAEQQPDGSVEMPQPGQN